MWCTVYRLYTLSMYFFSKVESRPFQRMSSLYWKVCKLPKVPKPKSDGTISYRLYFFKLLKGPLDVQAGFLLHNEVSNSREGIRSNKSSWGPIEAGLRDKFCHIWPMAAEWAIWPISGLKAGIKLLEHSREINNHVQKYSNRLQKQL